MAIRLVLFDIDGTLLDCNGRTRAPLTEALEEVFGEAGPIASYDFAGRTDDGIVRDLLAGLPPARVAAGIPRVRESFVAKLERTLDRGAMRLLPAVEETLTGLAAADGVTVGLLTGNWEAGARVKLSRFALNRFFGFGAFGDEQPERHTLPPLALARAAEWAGRRFRAEETIIVGDTERDVECAHAHGIAALGVATGSRSAAQLESAGADWVCHNLGSADTLLALMNGAGG